MARLGIVTRTAPASLAAMLPLLAAGLVEAAEAPQSSSGMPQLDPTHYSAQLFWLVVTFVIFYWVVSKLVLPRISGVLEDRQHRVDRDLSKATDLKIEAEQVKVEYERAAAEGRARAQHLLRGVAEEAAAIAARRHADLAETLSRDIKSAEERIARARDDAIGNVRGVAADIAATAVERLVDVKIDEARAVAAVESVAKEQR